MKISVIITNYNYARYLPTAVGSVLAQTYSNIEIIIVDDGSQDNSRDVITQLQAEEPQKIKAIFQENQGQGAAFNTAFAASTGEIIAFLDADDTWKADKLQQVIAAFNDPKVIGVMHQLENIDSDGQITNANCTITRIPHKNLAEIIINTGHAWAYPPTSALSYRRQTLEQVFPIDTTIWRLWADGCLVYCTAFLGEIKILDKVLGSYRIHDKNNHYYSGEKKAQIKLNNVMDQKYAHLKWQTGMQQTNQGINRFLEQINYPGRIDLSRNLHYRRILYYWKQEWDLREMLSISNLILNWEFYTLLEKFKYLTWFWIKSISLVVYSFRKKATHPASE